MPNITLKSDTLDFQTSRFAPARISEPLFVNSLMKSGSHLLKNILRMFVPLDQQYREQFIQWQNLRQHLHAFQPEFPFFSYGHLFFSDASAIELAKVRKVLLYRDPFNWVLARARFFLSAEFEGNAEFLKGGRLSVDELLTLMIFGIHPHTPSLADMYQFNVAAWLGSPSVYTVRYEDLVSNVRQLETTEAERFFSDLLAACGISPLPADWRERVEVGSDRRHSGTARENLTGIDMALPDSLPERHRRLVEYAAPGLRGLLGYE